MPHCGKNCSLAPPEVGCEIKKSTLASRTNSEKKLRVITGNCGIAGNCKKKKGDLNCTHTHARARADQGDEKFKVFMSLLVDLV